MIPARWVVMLVFTLLTSLSYLDRQLLAALAPAIQSEFHLTNADYGLVVSTFSLVYALTSPLAGIVLDKAGLNVGAIGSLALWSLAGIATGFSGSLNGLLACRAWLGLAESGSIPAAGKASALYLQPGERPLGAAVNQLAISLGLIVAPILAGVFAVRWGWRAAFVASGLLGLLWIPLWLLVSRSAPRNPLKQTGRSISELIGDTRLWGLIGGNVLGMLPYSLWMNWITIFLVRSHGLSAQEANSRLAWIPPLFAAAGGLAGGVLGAKFAARGMALVPARLRAMLFAAIAMAVTAAAPFAPTPNTATALICWSFFWAVAFSVNVYVLPIDYFGPERAATGIAALTFAYGLMQTVASPAIGRAVDLYGFQPVCIVISAAPIIAWLLLRATARIPRTA